MRETSAPDVVEQEADRGPKPLLHRGDDAARSRPRRQVTERLRFRILGPLEVERDERVISVGGPKQRVVLANLLVRANELVAAESLIDAIWGDDAPASARSTLHTYVSRLRSAIGVDRIEGQTPGYRLVVDPAELDATRFEALLKDARAARAINPRISAAILEEGLGLWRGSALADVAEDGALLAEAGRLDGLRMIAAEERNDALLAIGDHARVIVEAEASVDRHPLRERGWQQSMLALYRDGRQADALNAYQRLREILADELGIDPSPDLMRLHERILRHDPGLELRGEPLRGYRLLEKVGEGPTGVVFRATQPHVGREVAIKIVHEQLATDPAFVRRFEQEAQKAAALEHPHIVPVYDYWRDPDRAYVVSRYLKGGSLGGVEARGERPRADPALMLEQIASALAFAHGQHIAHGRVEPSNVLFDGEGNAYLGDFRLGVGDPDAGDDVQGFASIVQGVLGADVPPTLEALVERAELGTDVPSSDAMLAALGDRERRSTEVAATGELVRNPYKGLRAFSEADATDYFGRSELIARLLRRLGKDGVGSRFVAVVGPSGIGKSSVVRAGLVPAIRAGALGDPERVFVAEMFPGVHPIDELEAALIRVSMHAASRLRDPLEAGSRGLLDAMDLALPAPAELVLVVDQFEEVFTLTTDERERELFLETLRVATADPHSRVRVIVTLRADFFDRPLVYPRVGELLATGTEVVSPLSPDETEQAIRLPADGVGVRAEPGVVAEIIAEVANQPGALPLLQYALTELFERREGDRLTLDAYLGIGGVAGALSSRADHLYASMGPDVQRTTRQVFLRLVTLGEGREDTRRRVVRSELDALEVDTRLVDEVVDTFGRHRLLTFDRDSVTREPTVEIAHEALLVAWERFRRWIDDARDDLRQDRRLARAAAEWRGSDGDPSFLLRGARLQQTAAWASTTDVAIGKQQRGYLKASLDERERELAEEAARREREERTERRSRARLRALVAVLSVAALIAGTLTVVATAQRDRADRESGRAAIEARLSFARELAAASIASIEQDPERSILLAMEAIDVTRSVDGTVLPEAEQALHRAVVGSRLVRSFPGVGGSLAWSTKGGVFVTEGPEGTGTIEIRDVATGGVVRSFTGHDGDVTDVAFSPDGSKLATTGVDGELNIWDPATGRLLSSSAHDGEAWGPSFSRDSPRVAAAWRVPGSREDTVRVSVRVLDLETGLEIFAAREPASDVTPNPDTAISPDGQRVAVSTWKRIVVLGIGAAPAPLTLSRSAGEEVAWSPNGERIAGATYDGAVFVWDARTGAEIAAAFPGVFPSSVDWSFNSELLLTGDLGGMAKVWRIGVRGGADEEMSFSAQGTGGGIGGVAFSPDATEVMVGDVGATMVRIWDRTRSGDEELANPEGWHWINSVEFSGELLVSYLPIDLMLFDPRAEQTMGTFGESDGECHVEFQVSADGRVLAASDGTETVHGYDTSSRDTLFTHRLPCDGRLRLSPDGNLLAVSGWPNGSVRILDASDVVRTLPSTGGPLRVVGFGRDGRLLATSDASGASVWDWQQERELLEIPLDPATIDTDGYAHVLAFDGDVIVTARDDGVVELWDAHDGARVATLVGHTGFVTDAAFSPDGARIATAGYDGTTRLYAVRSGVQQLVLQGDEEVGAVHAVAFSADGSMLATHGVGWVRVWALDIDELLEIARSEVERPFTDAECRQYLHVDRCPAS